MAFNKTASSRVSIKSEKAVFRVGPIYLIRSFSGRWGFPKLLKAKLMDFAIPSRGFVRVPSRSKIIVRASGIFESFFNKGLPVSQTSENKRQSYPGVEN